MSFLGGEARTMIHIITLIKELTGRLKAENLHRVLVAALILIIVGSVAFWALEENLDLADALWWSVVTATTVGYGDISPATTGGRLVGVVLMLLGIGFLGVLTATIAGVFIENKLMEARGMKPSDAAGHFIICNWNFAGRDIITELRADDKSKDAPLVVLADREENPAADDKTHFVRGEVTEEALARANAGRALGVIILGDGALEPHLRDAKTILDCLTIKSCYPDVYTTVELMESKNVGHAERANADEVIVVGEISTGLLVQSALDHGITSMITELVSNRFGSELYSVKVPGSMVGRSFYDVMCSLKKDHQILCLGLQSASDGKLSANPPADRGLESGDRLVVIAADRPQLT
jgi:voltage-gated potassium channel